MANPVFGSWKRLKSLSKFVRVTHGRGMLAALRFTVTVTGEVDEEVGSRLLEGA